MKRYWVIPPYHAKSQIFEKVWEYDLANGTIAVGWKDLGDISELKEKSELEARYREVYGDAVAQVVTRDVNALWGFHHEISPGDVVIARRGTKKIIGIGTVNGSPFYDEDKGRKRVAGLTEDFYSRFIPVKWEEKEKEFDRIVFSFYTIYEISEEKYRTLTEAKTDTEITEQSAEFALEKHLEYFIVKNFGSIFGGRLELYVDDGGIGQQYPVVGNDGKEIGYIDILAREPSTNSYVVIELKKGRESDKVIGQILRYMGWVTEYLCQGGENVKGLIICKDVDEKLVYALKIIQNIVEVKRYTVDFQLID